jgi:CheY-like chemotaxis protein
MSVTDTPVGLKAIRIDIIKQGLVATAVSRYPRSSMMTTLQKILYVDDDRIMLDLAHYVLEKNGVFKVEVSMTCEEALAKVATFMPDLILTDVYMPDLDGFSMLRKLRSQPWAEDIPAVLMTGDMNQRDPQSLRALGIIDVIHKPFEPGRLVEQLQAIWDKQLEVA